MKHLDEPSQHHPMPFTRLELAIFSVVDGHLKVLLARRSGEPHKGRWALPGGVLRIDLDRSLENAAMRVAQERLGTGLPFLRQLCAVGGPERDLSRAPWALSIVYRALVPADALTVSPGKRIEALDWRSTDEAFRDKKLAFDHAKLIEESVQATRNEVRRLDFPKGFIPEEFTLGELQDLSEQILGERIDKSSFRRKLADRRTVVAVDGKTRTGANRPAQIYRLSLRD